MKRKGFTLIELLAVIVVLAIIAIIAIPTITSVIEKAEKGALKDSAYGLVDAASLYYAQYGEGARFDFDTNGNVTSNTDKELGYKGSVKNGTLIINKKGQILVCINENKYGAYKNYIESEVILSENCNVPENSSIVYIGEDKTIEELTNDQLTLELEELEQRINALVIQTGTEDISSVGDGTTTGAVDTLSEAMMDGAITFTVDSEGNYGYIKDGEDTINAF